MVPTLVGKGKTWTLRAGCGAWGCGQYEQVFRDNDIDEEVLPHLTADDLTVDRRDLGGSSPARFFPPLPL